MNKKTSYSWRAALTKVAVAMMMIAAVAFIPTYTALAAKAPTISKKTVNIMVKSNYDLNITNEIKGSSYVWTSDNESVATVDATGNVRGKTRGNAVITCKITSGKTTYTVSSKVKVISGAKSFAIKNKITILNQGQVYDVNRTITPFTSNDVTTWSSSDVSIAKPDKNGKFTALKPGTVTITGKTLSGKTDSMTVKIIDADGAVATQAEMEELLKLGVKKITLRTEKEVTFTIPEGNYNKVTLVVDAPKADIYNYGVFKAIDIYRVAPATFHEHAKGNKLVVRSATASIEVADDASVSIEITSEGAKVTIKNDNGEITGVVMMSAADLTISGKSDKPIPVDIRAEGASITTSTPLTVTAEAPAALTLEKGAESTTIASDTKANIPTIYGDVTISVVVGTGATQEKVEVKGEKIKIDEPAAPSIPSNPGGGYVSDPGYTTQTIGSTIRYTLTKPVAQIKRIKISFIVPVTVDGDMLTTLLTFLNDSTGSLTKWRANKAVNKTYGIAGNVFTIQASIPTGDTRIIKLVSTPLGLLDGREYTATLETVDPVAKTGKFSISGANTYLEITKVSDTVLDIKTNISNLNFVPEF